MVQTCELLCEDLRRSVGLTLFRIELARRSTPLVITLRGGREPGLNQRHDWMRHGPPARIERSMTDQGRELASIRIEDEHRSEYPDDAGERVDTVIARYASEIAALVDEGQL